MAEFIRAVDGRFLNVDHVYEFVPMPGGDTYVAHYSGADEYGDAAQVSGALVRQVVAAKRAPGKSGRKE